jgi:hypothetical protein
MKKYTILLFILLILVPAKLFAANMTLEIINIKPAGTGSPAIPSTNRIFRAYPGIEYNIRAAVIGGLYPYTYSLSIAPSGMTIDSRTGEITWPNPTTGGSPHSCTIKVIDDEATEVTASWSISVSTSGFLFVNSSYSGAETGSISQPYSSMDNLFSDQTDNITAIVYFRAGTYSMPSISSMGSRPHNWIGYPGESVTINMQQRQGVWTEAAPYFDSLYFTNMLNHGIHMYGPRSYHTIRRCVYDGLTTDTGENNNQGMIPFLGGEGDRGYGSVIQDNEFTDFPGGNAIGSLYRMEKFLIENNYFYAPGIKTGPSHNAISPKALTRIMTIRGNKMILNSSSASFFGKNNSDAEENVEMCYNLFVNTSAERISVFNNWNIGQKDTWFYRNTLLGDYVIRTCDYDAGPFSIHNNVISNPNTSWDEGSISNYITYNDGTGCFTQTDNLTDTVAANLVDSEDDYKLVSGQSGYIGSRGWQLSDGSIPMDPETTTPSQSGVTMSGVTIGQ